jgi:peptidoglycan/LPS O-acetylase OafA/YrhL
MMPIGYVSMRLIEAPFLRLRRSYAEAAVTQPIGAAGQMSA